MIKMIVADVNISLQVEPGAQNNVPMLVGKSTKARRNRPGGAGWRFDSSEKYVAPGQIQNTTTHKINNDQKGNLPGAKSLAFEFIGIMFTYCGRPPPNKLTDVDKSLRS